MVEKLETSEDKTVVAFGKRKSRENLEEINSSDLYQASWPKKGATKLKKVAFAGPKRMLWADKKENYCKKNRCGQVERQAIPACCLNRGQEGQQKYPNSNVCSNSTRRNEEVETESSSDSVKPEKFSSNSSCSLSCCPALSCYCFATTTSGTAVDLRGQTLASAVVNSGELSGKEARSNDRIRRREAKMLAESGCEANQIQSHQNDDINIINNNKGGKFTRAKHLKTRERLKFNRQPDAPKLQRAKAHLIRLQQKDHSYNQEFAAKTENTIKVTSNGGPARVFQMFVWMLTLAILANSFSVAESVDCFKCSSRNGSNPACEDPFHNLNTTKITSPFMPDPAPNVIYHTPCYAGKKGREGLFPASACIKLTGTFARMSHCGKFQFEGDLLKGCVLACPEDACNSAQHNRVITELPLAFLISALAQILAHYFAATLSFN